MTIGTIVEVLEPFSEVFPGQHTVASIVEVEGGTVVMLEGVESAFDPKFLKEV